jgi:hypothetical protein
MCGNVDPEYPAPDDSMLDERTDSTGDGFFFQTDRFAYVTDCGSLEIAPRDKLKEARWKLHKLLWKADGKINKYSPDQVAAATKALKEILGE